MLCFYGLLIVFVINGLIAIFRNLYYCKMHRKKYNVIKGLLNLYIKDEIGKGWWISHLVFTVELLVQMIIVLVLSILELLVVGNFILDTIHVAILIHFFVNIFGTIRE